jgi:CubicO group peptidase (beta-lactamase class C family)
MRTWLIAVVLALGLGGCGAAAPVACDEGLDAWAGAGFEGALAVVAGGEACTWGEGVYDIGSVTKVVTAAAVMALAEEGRLGLEDRAGEHLPGLHPPVADLTVGDLLAHTSGLTGTHAPDDRPLGRDEALAAIDRLEVVADPGDEERYSNAGYTLLAAIVEAATGRPFRDVLAAEVLTLPDGTVAAELGPPNWALEGNGGLRMTPAALAAWTAALFGRDLPGLSSPPAGWAAFDAGLLGAAGFGASGGGGDSGEEVAVAWFPEQELALVVASGAGSAVAAGTLLRSAAPALLAGEPVPGPGGGGDPALAGTYALPGDGRFEVTVAGDGLAVTALGPSAVAALFPADPDEAAAHERLVTALLAGETGEGRREREALEADVGTVTGTDIEVTGLVEGELRTYVTLRTSSGDLRAWYALDDDGGVAGAELEPGPPALRLTANDEGTFQPLAGGPPITATFADDTLTIHAPTGATESHRTPSP